VTILIAEKQTPKQRKIPRILYRNKMATPRRHRNLKVYAQNDRATKYVKQKLITFKEERNRCNCCGTLPFPRSTIDRTSRQKVSEEMEFNNAIIQQNPPDMYGTFYPTVTEYTFFLSSSWDSMPK
jgi:hypothetical protein